MRRLSLRLSVAAISALLLAGAGMQQAFAVWGTNENWIMQQGQTLKAGEARTYDGYRLSIQKGDLQLVSTKGEMIWHTNTMGSGANRLKFQTDGNLVLSNAKNSAVWKSGTNGTGLHRGVLVISATNKTDLGNCAQKASLSVRGVIMEANYIEAWSSCTYSTITFGEIPIRSGRYISDIAFKAGRILVSPNKKYHLDYQADGNLVLYAPSGAIWNSGSNGKPSTYLSTWCGPRLEKSLIHDNCTLTKPDPNATWTMPGDRLWIGSQTLAMQDDGNLVNYGSDFATKVRRVLWSSNTAGQG